jgi:hypothetical protein
LFDDIAKQIQSSINVFLKTFTLLTNLLGASLDSFDNIRTRIEGSVDKIKSQLQGLNINIPSLPSLDNLQRNINTGVSNFANSSLKGVQDKINTGIANAIPSIPPPPPPYQQTGGIKNIKKNINSTSKRITKKLNMFYNRKYKTNMTRRHHK